MLETPQDEPLGTVSFRVSAAHCRQLRSRLALAGISLQDWGQVTVAELIGEKVNMVAHRAVSEMRAEEG